MTETMDLPDGVAIAATVMAIGTIVVGDTRVAAKTMITPAAVETPPESRLTTSVAKKILNRKTRLVRKRRKLARKERRRPSPQRQKKTMENAGQRE